MFEFQSKRIIKIRKLARIKCGFKFRVPRNLNGPGTASHIAMNGSFIREIFPKLIAFSLKLKGALNDPVRPRSHHVGAKFKRGFFIWNWLKQIRPLASQTNAKRVPITTIFRKNG